MLFMNEVDLNTVKELAQTVCGKKEIFDIANIVYVILGGILATVGGFLGGYFLEKSKMKMEKDQEKGYLKMMLNDELDQIIGIVDKLEETHKQSNTVHKPYVEDLKKSIESWKECERKIILFEDGSTRSLIFLFNKDLKEYIQKVEPDCDSLKAGAKAKERQNEIKDGFLTFRSRAKKIKEDLK